MNDHATFLAMIEREFSRYLIDHDELAAQIPTNALIIFQVENEPSFNHWHRDLAMRHREPGQPMVEIHVQSLRSTSLIEKLDLVPA